MHTLHETSCIALGMEDNNYVNTKIYYQVNSNAREQISVCNKLLPI